MSSIRSSRRPGGGSGGGLGSGDSAAGRALNAAREAKCLATATGLVQRSSTDSCVGEASQSNMWEVVWGAEEHSGQISVSDRPILNR